MLASIKKRTQQKNLGPSCSCMKKKTLPWQHNNLWTGLRLALDWPWNMALKRWPWAGLGMVLDYGLRIVLKQCWPEYGYEMALKYGLKENLEWQFGRSALEYQPWKKYSLGNSHIISLKYTLELAGMRLTCVTSPLCPVSVPTSSISDCLCENLRR